MAYLKSCIRGGSRDKRPGWIIEFPYREETILELKRAIPQWGPGDIVNREWRPASKTWWVSEEYEHIIERLFSNFAAIRDQQARLPL